MKVVFDESGFFHESGFDAFVFNSLSFGPSVVSTMDDDMSYSASCSNGCGRLLLVVLCLLRCVRVGFLTKPYVHVVACNGVS